MSLLNGKPREAIEFGETALALKVEPKTLWVLAEAYLAIGDTVRARESMAAMDASAMGQALYAAMNENSRAARSGGLQ